MNLNITYKVFYKLVSVLAILCFVVVGELSATHIVGGDLTYRPLGNDDYEVTLTIRRDCELGDPEAQFDDPAIIGIYSGVGVIQLNLGTNGLILLPFQADDTLNTIITSECGFEGVQVCVHETVYKQIVHLPFKSGGYNLAYQRCCRNESINNIVLPVETGATYEVQISETSLITQNASPVFTDWPSIYICADEDFVFDHSAVDAEGDSLVYKLSTPNTGATIGKPRPVPPSNPPYETVEFVPPFSLENLMGGGALIIDPETGMMTAKPNAVGQFLVGVSVEEYRDGVKIGEVKRDFEVNVRICSAPPIADFELEGDNCNGLETTFNNLSTTADRFEWNFNYPTEDSLFFSSEENPTFTYLEEGTYDVQLTVYRGSDECQNQIIKSVTIRDIGFTPDFEITPSGCDDQDSLSITLKDLSTSNDPDLVINSVSWEVTQNGTSTSYDGDNITIKVGQEDFSVTLDVVGDEVCFGSVSKDIIYQDLVFKPDFNISLISCSTDSTATFTLMDLTQENNPLYTMIQSNWIVVVESDTISLSGANPFFEIPRKDFEVTLTATADDNCSATITKSFNIEDLFPVVDFSATLLNCDDSNAAVIQFSENVEDNGSIATYQWNIDGVAYEGQNVEITTNKDVITASLSIILENGCSSTLEKQIAVNELRPRPRFTYAEVECPEGIEVTVDFNYDDQLANGISANTIKWTIGPENIMSEGTTTQATLPINTPLTVNIEVEYDNSCTEIYEETITFGPYASIDFGGDTVGICPLEEKPIVLNPNPDFTYTWSPTEGLDLTDPSNPIVSVSQDMTYSVTVTDGLCTVETMVFVDLLDDLKIEVSGVTDICGSEVMLMASGAAGEGIYEWSDVADFSNIISTGVQFSDDLEEDSKTYFVRFVGEFCEAEPAEVTVTKVTPNIVIANPFEACSADQFLLPVTTEGGQDVSIIWTENTHILGPLDVLTPEIAIGEGESGSFTLYYSVSKDGCVANDSVVISIIDSPVITFSTSREDCETYKICFKVEGNYSGEILWDFGDTASDNDVSSSADVCYTYPSDGQYQVVLTNQSVACKFDDLIEVINLYNKDLDLLGDADKNVCSGDMTTISPLVTDGLSFVWKNEAGEIIGTDKELTITVEDMAVITVQATDQFGCTYDDALNLKAMDSNPMLLLPDPFTACVGDVFILPIENANPEVSVTVVWESNEHIIEGDSTLNPKIAIGDNEVGSFDLFYTATSEIGCETQGSITINIAQTPAEVKILATRDDCAALTVCFSIEGDYSGSVSWNFGDASVESDTSVAGAVCYTYPSIGQYQVSLSNTSTICQFPDASLTIDLYDEDLDLLGDADKNVCSGDMTTISPLVTDGLSFVWKNEAGEIIGTDKELTITVEDMAVITVQATDQFGCTYDDALNLKAVDGNPMLLLAEPFEACVGDEFRLPVTNPNEDLNVTVQWAIDEHIIAGMDSLSPTIKIGENETDTFELAYTATSEIGCEVQGSFRIAVAQSVPDISWDYTMEDCYNFKVCFKVNGDFKGNIHWDFGDPSTERDTSNSADVCYTYPVEGEYTIVLSNQSDICQFADLSQDILLRKIGDPVSVDVIEECIGEITNVSPSEIIDGMTYVWTDAEGNVVGDGADLNVVVEVDEKYLLTATDLNGCIYLDSVKVYAIDEFPQFLLVEPYEVCFGDTIELAIANENPDHDITIMWEPHPYIVGPLDILNPMIGIPMEEMEPFQLVYTASTQFGCEITDTIDFIVGEQSVVDIAYEVENCDEYTVCFKPDGDYSGFAIWNFGDPTTNSDVSFMPEVCYTYPGPGTYTVELTNRGFCAFAPVTKTITLNDDILIFGDNDSTTICGSTEAMLTVPTEVEGSMVEWFDSEGNSLGTDPSVTINISEPNFVGLTVYDQNNCPFTDTLYLEPFMFDYTINAPDVFCLDTEIDAEVVIEGDVEYQYLWGPPECIISGGNTSAVKIDVTLEKDVFVMITHPDLGCVVMDTIQIDPQSLEITASASPDAEINLGENVDIQVDNQEGDWTYEWSNGSNEGTQTVSPEETTTYTVTVTDENGCTGVASVEIRVNPPDCEEDIFIPTAFSPNGDNTNDILYVRSNFIETMTLIIYNRWGEEVFTSNNVATGWDGRHQGAELSPDVYAYYLTARCTDGTDIVRRGNVSLLR